MRVYLESVGAKVRYSHVCGAAEPDFETFLGSIKEDTKGCYIVNPNNPTGTIWSPEQVKQVCRLRRSLLVVLDEAYIEFGGETAVSLLETEPNLVIARTFSKAFGLAGVRIGYILANDNILEPLKKVRIGKNINSLAQIAALSALKDINHTKEYVRQTREGGHWLAEQLRALNYPVKETPANFIMVDVGDPDACVQRLAEQGMFVRNRKATKGFETYIRVTTGPQTYMEKFLESWNSCIGPRS